MNEIIFHASQGIFLGCVVVAYVAVPLLVIAFIFRWPRVRKGAFRVASITGLVALCAGLTGLVFQDKVRAEKEAKGLILHEIVIPETTAYPRCRRLTATFESKRSIELARKLEDVCSAETGSKLANLNSKNPDPCTQWADDVAVAAYQYRRQAGRTENGFDGALPYVKEEADKCSAKPAAGKPD